MRRIRGSLALQLCVVLGALSLLITGASFAELTYAPEFTVKIVDHSYDEPPAYITDPYTGESKLAWIGGHVDNKTMDFAIKNQPFTPYKDTNGNEIELYYNIQTKGQFENWSASGYGDIVPASSSEYTLKSYIVSKPYWNLPPGGTVNIRIKVMIGYYTFVPDPLRSGFYHEGQSAFTTLQSSGWSSIQTITMPKETPSSSPASQPAQTTTPPTITSSPILSSTNYFAIDITSAVIVVVITLVTVMGFLLLVLHRRIQKVEQLVKKH